MVLTHPSLKLRGGVLKPIDPQHFAGWSYSKTVRWEHMTWGKGQWTETQGSCNLYIALCLCPAAAACSSCVLCRLSILTVQAEFVQFLESTVCTRARPGSVSNMTLQMIGSSWCLNTAGARLRLFCLCIKASREFELILRKNLHIWSVIKPSQPPLFTVPPPMGFKLIKKKKKVFYLTWMISSGSGSFLLHVL